MDSLRTDAEMLVEGSSERSHTKPYVHLHQLRRLFWHVLSHFYGKDAWIIGLKAPGNYSDSSWSNKISVLLCEGPKPPNSMICGCLKPRDPFMYGFKIYQITSNI